MGFEFKAIGMYQSALRAVAQVANGNQHVGLFDMEARRRKQQRRARKLVFQAPFKLLAKGGIGLAERLAAIAGYGARLRLERR
ncbi:hypothetical protein AA18890_2798 [Komagataeibacter europaeus LMG 18890]|nr:hypothetical protein AA18890_2798 [Komagataeibacter europaeus LMG 18890]